eukprot:2271-Heterococcus_DN1.PRE.7
MSVFTSRRAVQLASSSGRYCSQLRSSSSLCSDVSCPIAGGSAASLLQPMPSVTSCCSSMRSLFVSHSSFKFVTRQTPRGTDVNHTISTSSSGQLASAGTTSTTTQSSHKLQQLVCLWYLLRTVLLQCNFITTKKQHCVA